MKKAALLRGELWNELDARIAKVVVGATEGRKVTLAVLSGDMEEVKEAEKLRESRY